MINQNVDILIAPVIRNCNSINVSTSHNIYIRLDNNHSTPLLNKFTSAM